MDKKNQIELPKKREVIQSFLITTARYKFSIYEKRILSKIISCLQPLLEGKKLEGRVERTLFETRFELPMSFFTNDTNYARYLEAFKSLATKGIDVNNNNIWAFYNLIHSPKFIKNRAIVLFSISDELVELFLNFSKGYSKYILEISMELKSTASARLYELISNQPHALKYNIDTLKEILDPTHIYPKTCNFIQRIIDPAKKELDDVANWSFSYNPIKKGRKYVGLELSPINFKDREPKEIQDAELKRRVNLSWSIVEREIRNFLKKECGFSDREIKNNIATIQKYIRTFADNSLGSLMEIWSRSQDKRNPKGYLIGVMKLETELTN